MTNKIKVGVAGCGYWGPNLIRNFRALPDCQVKIIAEVNEARHSDLSKNYPEVEITHLFPHMLNGINLDGVVIATPVHTHYSLAKLALEAGKHVFIEKPITDCLEHAQELVDLARKNGLVLMVGHVFLYSPYVQAIKGILNRGDAGNLCSITSRRLNHNNFPKGAKNSAWDLAPHDLAIGEYFFGAEPVSVSCTGSDNIVPGIHDTTTMVIKYPGGRFFTIENSWTHFDRVREMVVKCSEGMMRYVDNGPDSIVEIIGHRIVTTGSGASTQHVSVKGEPVLHSVAWNEPLAAECQEFLDAIKSHREPRTCGRQGAQVVKILEAADLSMNMGGEPVSLNRSFVYTGHDRELTPLGPRRELVRH